MKRRIEKQINQMRFSHRPANYVKYLFPELQDEIQRYKDELEIAGMQAQ